MRTSNSQFVCSQLPIRNPEKQNDILRLHELIPTIGDEGALAIYFRYWEMLLIEDIAKILGKSWGETDQLIENSIKKLRQGFLMKIENALLDAA